MVVQLRTLMMRLIAIAALSICLSGCVDYELGIDFDSQTHGTLVQTLHLNDQFVSLNSDVRQQWLQVFIQEAKTFSGKATSLDDGTLQVTIDFNNGADLVKKFNQLFAADGPMTQVPGAPPLLAHLDLSQQNFGVALLNHLQAEIDLRGLSADQAIGEGGALDGWRTLSLSFDIDSIADASHWPLTPGEVNTLDATFWIPSPIGIGAGVIILLCAGGYGVRHGLLNRP
ncbi:DUF3153 domain-containing protein [Leptothoe kymatousa]|uniref:DUF3153 domain-containing protein n=1 Tax=Leptothoe kymatousa TAU-MAC 1615 TaxID=2364775 RepID=A0ABS5XZI2_9CYAN|nr:DUF3153 domain-containing protein [Leptothoe kymatousa]MBT9310649.1 DUF3153 domain-containing protein [Leptothoe kymatousa TAU-MAC 1615]